MKPLESATRRPSVDSSVCLALHKVALEIHRSSSLARACRILADALIEYELVTGFRATLGIEGPSPPTDLLVAPGEDRFDAEDDTFLAHFTIELPTADQLFIEVALPGSSDVGDQVFVEILLEHLCTASRNLPIHELPPEPDHHFLTRREREVLPHILAGCTNNSIANLLGISPRTVEKHITSLLRKFECEKRTELMAREFRKYG